MGQQEEPVSLGRYLRSLRVKRGLGLAEASRRTHISRQNLLLIEAEDYARLPAPVHVKGFLRTYAELLRINPERVLQHYTENLMVHENRGQESPFNGRFGFWPRLVLALTILATVIAVTLFSASLWDQPPGKHAKTVTSIRIQPPDYTGNQQLVQTNRFSGGNSDDLSATLTGQPGISKLKLKVIALEKAQLKIIIDGQPPKVYALKPEDRLDLEAALHFNLLMDNVEGLELYFNEKRIRLDGKAGQNVTIHLP